MVLPQSGVGIGMPEPDTVLICYEGHTVTVLLVISCLTLVATSLLDI